MMPAVCLANAPAASDTIHAFLVHPDRWPTLADFVTWCQKMDPISGAVLIMAGVWFLFSGFKMHRSLVAGNAVVIGAYLGAGLALHFGFPLLAGIPAGALILGVIGYYFTSASAAALGAVCGALIGAAVWAMCNLPPALTWSGALTGAVALGLLCFIIFRTSVIVFTSMQGSVMLVLGLVGLAYQYPFVKPSLESWLIARPMALPAVILALMLIGMGFQYLKGPAGGKAGASGGGGGGGGSSSSKSDSSSKDSAAKKEKSKA